jgi:GNAT superfamily N-acetyltransferase
VHEHIAIARTDKEIEACYPVMAELRPHLSKDGFVALVKHLAETSRFELAYLRDEQVRSVAGYRLSEWLAGGKYLEIEDLVSASADRSKGYGSELFDWLVKLAEQHDCRHVRLVSNVRRLDAHRFYLRKGMTIEAHYFSMNVGKV